MNASPNFPPSNRDFQVYQRVVLEAATTRQVASDFSLSQTRIRQIVQRVSQWLANTLPRPSEADDSAYLRLAQHVATDRLQYVYGQAMRGWRLTNEAKYAGIVLRVIAAHSKLPVIPGTLDALHADALDGLLPDDCSVGPNREASAVPLARNSERPTSQSSFTSPPSSLSPPTPPLGDCSTSASILPILVAQPIPQRATTPLAPTTSIDRDADRAAARRAFLAPTHHAPTTGDLGSRHTSCAVTELKVTPENLGFSIQKKLSRRQRRKLRKASP